MEKIYLSGPITGFDLSEREKAFNEEERKFKSRGYKEQVEFEKMLHEENKIKSKKQQQ